MQAIVAKGNGVNVLNRAGERGQIFSPSGRGAGCGRFLNFVAPVLIFQRNASRGACVIAARGCAQSPPDNPQGPPRDKQEEAVSAPGPSIDPARAGGLYAPQQGSREMDHSTPKWVPATCCKRLIKLKFFTAPVGGQVQAMNSGTVVAGNDSVRPDRLRRPIVNNRKRNNEELQPLGPLVATRFGSA